MRISLLAFLIFLSIFNLAHANIEFTGKVVGVSDGDTISVMCEGYAERIRLHGVDCPESHQAFGTKAKRFTSTLSFGQRVTIEIVTKDKYQRLVGIVILPDGRNLNHELVKAGFAWWYRKYAPNDQVLMKLERQAKRDKRGLWKDSKPVPPWEFRHQKQEV